MFLLHYTCSVFRSRNSRKAFKFLSKRLVLLLYGNLCFVHKTTYLWSMRSPGGGELSLSACPGVGNRPPNENKIAIPRGYPRGGMVTGRIEPCINAARSADETSPSRKQSRQLRRLVHWNRATTTPAIMLNLMWSALESPTTLKIKRDCRVKKIYLLKCTHVQPT